MTYEEVVTKLYRTNSDITDISDRRSFIIMYELDDKKYIINRSVKGAVQFKNLDNLFNYIGINSKYFFKKIIKSWYKTDSFNILEVVELDNYNRKDQGVLNRRKRFWAELNDAIVIRNNNDWISLHEMSFKDFIYKTVDEILEQIMYCFDTYKKMYCDQHYQLFKLLRKADRWFENVYEKGSLHSRWAVMNCNRIPDDMRCVLVSLFDELLERYNSQDQIAKHPLESQTAYYTGRSIDQLYQLRKSLRIKNKVRACQVRDERYNHILSIYGYREYEALKQAERRRQEEEQRERCRQEEERKQAEKERKAREYQQALDQWIRERDEQRRTTKRSSDKRKLAQQAEEQRRQEEQRREEQRREEQRREEQRLEIERNHGQLSIHFV